MDKHLEFLLTEVEMIRDYYITEEKLPSAFLSNRRWRDIFSKLCFAERQSEVVPYLFDGNDEEQIGDDLSISSNTIHAHVEKKYYKLGVHNRADLITKIFVTYLSYKRNRKAWLSSLESSDFIYFNHLNR